MKRNYFSLFAAASMMMAVTSCSQEENIPQVDSEMATFEISLEGASQSRTAGDGLTAINLYYEVYQGTKTEPVIDATATLDGGKATIEMPLLRGEKYDIMFWAQKDGAIYNAENLKAIEVDYSAPTANNEDYDAFFYGKKDFQATANVTKIELRRPFAQLNIGTTEADWKQAIAMIDESNDPVTDSKVKVTGLATKFNVLEGKAEGTADVEFTKANINGETFTAKGDETYYNLAMNYLLVPGTLTSTEAEEAAVKDFEDVKTTTEVTATFWRGTQELFSINNLFNVPIQRNWRTNILGNLLADNKTFEIEVVPAFWNDNNLDAAERTVISQEELLAALNDPTVNKIILGGNFEINQGIIFGAAARSAETIPAHDLTIDGNGKTLTFTGNTNNRLIDVASETNGMNLTLSNITILNKNSYVQRGINYNTNGTLTFDKAIIENDENCMISYVVNLPGNSDNATVDIKDSKFTGLIPLNIWGENVNVTSTNSIYTVVDNAEHEGYSGIKLNNDGTTAANGTTVTITGGEIKIEGDYSEDSFMTSNSTNGTITIGGTNVNELDRDEHTIKTAIVVYDDPSSFYSFETLQGAVDKVVSDNMGSVRLITDVELSEVLSIKGAVVIDGNGKTLTSTATRAINVDTNAEVTIKNLNIVGACTTNNDERGVNIIAPAITNLENVTISGVSHYAVNITTAGGAATLNIKDSKIEGYSAVQSWGENSTINVTNSELKGVNSYEDNNENSYATVLTYAKGIKLNVTGGSILAQNTKSAGQLIFASQNDCTGTEVTLNTELKLEGDNVGYLSYDPKQVSLKVKAEYAEALEAEGWLFEVKDGMAVVSEAVVKAEVETAEDFTAALADASYNVISLKEGVTIEGEFSTTGRNVIITSNPSNKATIKGRIELRNPNVTFKNVKFDYNDDSKKEFTSNVKQNPNGHPSIVGINGGTNDEAIFENCDFNFLSAYDFSKAPGAITHYGSAKLKLDGCTLDGTGNPIYAKTNVEMTGCTIKMNGNNAVLNLNYANETRKVIFKNNKVENKSTNGAKTYAMQFLSSNGKAYNNMFFDVQGNEGIDVNFFKGSGYTFTNATYAEGSATLE